ncbi:ImmA/IrrE family metallo-endopeptidase [Noviherbaspirillum malthae]|uniref:ImmA/IrrE family metallo-endopeptidase n=1 Tax=Noviherbaspirillum malthae TaxID=1260987 RepID=UPI00188F55D0|nr:hypothetical protein [Noviherbaspirillum malthae]
MTNFQIHQSWLAASSDRTELSQTMGMLSMKVGDIALTRNEDIWSQTVRDSVLTSAYPLALWFASSWWRLVFEPLPASGVRPSIDWRMAHELGAANHGFVWPQIMFVSDRETIQVFAVPSKGVIQQSVKYLNGLDAPASILLHDFQNQATNFVDSVISRLDALELTDTELKHLWNFVQQERSDPESAKYRSIEAAMGFDPDECPNNLMDLALCLDKRMGQASFSELSPVYGKLANGTPLTAIEDLEKTQGITCRPEIAHASLRAQDHSSLENERPWERGVSMAQYLRHEIGKPSSKLDSKTLYGLLGLTESQVEHYVPSKRQEVGVGVPKNQSELRIIPRKKHPVAKRFEFARFIGDYLSSDRLDNEWLTSTDLRTSRQKYQRAFAAEFLCPIHDLQNFLEDDYSETAIEDAAQHFEVSTETVTALLANNNLIPSATFERLTEARLPYQTGM